MKIDNVLTNRQIKDVYKWVSTVFAEDTQGGLTIDIANFKKQIDKILAEMKLTEVFHSSDGSHKGWKIANLNPRKKNMAARGYILIFKFREFLFNEKINYRYYYEDNQGISKATTFTEDNIAKFMKFGPQGIQINPAEAKMADAAGEYNDLINHFFNRYTSPDQNGFMSTVEGSYGRRVRSGIMEQYGGINPGLLQKNGKYQLFNKGHIYEAIDTSISKIIMDGSDTSNNSAAEQMMDNYVFGKYLALDNIKASQGGDNPLTNTSIKSGGADLYDFYTIKSQLKQIKEILNGGIVSQEDISKELEKMFLHQSKFDTEEAMHTTANQGMEKLFRELEKYLDFSEKK